MKIATAIQQVITSKITRISFGIAVLVGAVYFIGSEINTHSTDFFVLLRLIQTPFSLFSLAGIFILMATNWFLESKKWQFAMRCVTDISIKTSAKAVLGTLSLAIITPNRVGEIGGRAFFIDKQFRMQTIRITAITSMSQLVVTILFAAISIPILLDNFAPFLIIGYVIGIITLLLFVKLPSVIKVLQTIPYLKKTIMNFGSIGTLRTSYFIVVLAYSCMRYCVFIIQYLLLLHIFDVKIDILNGILCVGATYGLSTIIPTIAIAELGLRGAAAIMTFGIFSSNIQGVVAATFTLWFINVAIPSFIGSVFWIQILKSKKYGAT